MRTVADINEQGLFEGLTFVPIIEYAPSNKPSEALEAACNLLSAEVVGILGPTSPENSMAVRSVCDTKEVPVVEVHSYPYIMNGININFYPAPEVIECFRGSCIRGRQALIKQKWVL